MCVFADPEEDLLFADIDEGLFGLKLGKRVHRSLLHIGIACNTNYNIL